MACQFRVGNGIFLNFTGWPKKNLTETSKKYYDHQIVLMFITLKLEINIIADMSQYGHHWSFHMCQHFFRHYFLVNKGVGSTKFHDFPKFIMHFLH